MANVMNSSLSYNASVECSRERHSCVCEVHASVEYANEGILSGPTHNTPLPGANQNERRQTS